MERFNRLVLFYYKVGLTLLLVQSVFWLITCACCLLFVFILANTILINSIHLLSECYQATRIAYGGSKEFKRVVTLDGALFEKSGTMSGGGRKPRGGKMGTSIRASVSSEGVAQAERELAQIVDELSSLRHKISDAVRSYQAAEKAVYHLEMEVAKCQKEVCFYLVLNFQNIFCMCT